MDQKLSLASTLIMILPQYGFFIVVNQSTRNTIRLYSKIETSKLHVVVAITLNALKKNLTGWNIFWYYSLGPLVHLINQQGQMNQSTS